MPLRNRQRKFSARKRTGEKRSNSRPEKKKNFGINRYHLFVSPGHYSENFGWLGTILRNAEKAGRPFQGLVFHQPNDMFLESDARRNEKDFSEKLKKLRPKWLELIAQVPKPLERQRKFFQFIADTYYDSLQEEFGKDFLKNPECLNYLNRIAMGTKYNVNMLFLERGSEAESKKLSKLTETISTNQDIVNFLNIADSMPDFVEMLEAFGKMSAIKHRLIGSNHPNVFERARELKGLDKNDEVKLLVAADPLYSRGFKLVDNGKVKIKRARTINFPKTFTQMICDAFSRNPKFVPNPIIVKRALLEYLLSNRSLQEIFFLNFEKTHELVGKIKNLSDNEVEKIFERINGIGRQYFKKDKYQENILNVVNGFFKRKKEREREMRRISAIPTISAKPAQAQVPVILTPKKPAKKPKLETVKPAIVPEKKSTNNRFMEKQKRRIVNECLKNGFSPDQALHYFEIVDGRLEYEEAFLKVDDYLDISEKLNSAGIALDAVRRSLISQYLLYPHKRQEVIGTIHNLANRIESREAESKTGEKDFDMRKIKLLLRKAGRTHPRKLVSAFIAIGFRLFRQGNHPIYAKGMKRISLPVKEDVGLGGILLFAKQAQLSNEELTSLVEFLTK